MRMLMDINQDINGLNNKYYMLVSICISCVFGVSPLSCLYLKNNIIRLAKQNLYNVPLRVLTNIHIIDPY